jgi:hypothetical protein
LAFYHSPFLPIIQKNECPQKTCVLYPSSPKTKPNGAWSRWDEETIILDAANDRARRTFMGLSAAMSPAELRAELLATAHADGTED